jgi:hypothetical protein
MRGGGKNRKGEENKKKGDTRMSIFNKQDIIYSELPGKIYRLSSVI